LFGDLGVRFIIDVGLSSKHAQKKTWQRLAVSLVERERRGHATFRCLENEKSKDAKDLVPESQNPVFSAEKYPSRVRGLEKRDSKRTLSRQERQFDEQV